MPDKLYAHTTSRTDCVDWEPLAVHLCEVADMAASFAKAFGSQEAARVVGLLHDVGKASEHFQRYLRGEVGSTDHSTAGAKLAVERYGRLGRLLAFCVAGHHAGLADGTGGEGSTLEQRLRKQVESYARWQELGINLPAMLAPPSLDMRTDRYGFQCAFFTRMLFSCLVDADRLCTERFIAAVEGRTVSRDDWADFDSLKPKLEGFLAAKQVEADDTAVNRQRARILRHVRARAGEAPGLFSLTVPTGGGKTLTSLAWALDHASRYGHRRVIYVIPFTSIVEQTAAVFQKVLGKDAVLEHHSAFDPGSTKPDPRDEELPSGEERQRLAAENWDAPIVVTTAVQFFESLFAARTSRCRKLHNIARSIVILDEAQTLPLSLLLLCVASIDELARNYRTSIVLMTATQPALKYPDLRGGLTGVRELAPENLDQEPAFQRVAITHAGRLDADALATHLRAERQALCIVNSRRHARELYEAIRNDGDAFHLSTLMCAVHRREVLKTIRKRLKAKLPVRVVSTSLIEAGVDISFPIVLRAEAGLDQIAQAAGRCNREGELPPGELGRVVTFEAADHEPPAEIAQLASNGREILRHYADPFTSAAIHAYFRLTYFNKGPAALDKHKLLDCLDERKSSFDFPFAKIAAKFRMIDDVLVPVIVPYDGKARASINALEHVPRIGDILRKLRPYTVGVPRKVRAGLIAAHVVMPVRQAEFPDQLAVLVNLDLYRPDLGLTSDDPTFARAERLVG